MKTYLVARREELKKRQNKGFTLMEMLIVVAIIAVLIAIASPVFTSQLEKSRDSVSIANLRSAYAEASTACLASNGKATVAGNAKTAATANGKQEVTVYNVKFEGQAAGFSGLEKELAFTYSADVLGDGTEAGGVPGYYQPVFEFDTAANTCTLKGLGTKSDTTQEVPTT